MELKDYLSEISKYPILEKEQEFEIAKKAIKGDKESRDYLINSHLRLVVSIAKRYARNGNLEDLIGEGNLGLIKSLEKYDPNKNIRFSTYAYKGIETHIWAYLERQKMINLPREKKLLIKKIFSIINEYYVENGEEPSLVYIANKINEQQSERKYNKNEIADLIWIYNNISVISLNKPIKDKENKEIKDFIVKEDARENLNKKYLEEKIYNEIKELDLEETDKKIFEMILYEDKNIKEISIRLKMNINELENRYSRILRMIKSKLKDSEI